MTNMKLRTYHQRARAAATEETRTAILNAVDAIFLPDPGGALSLDDVAERARTTVQTVLRHFGSKAGLLEEAAKRGLARVKADRDEVLAGDLGGIAAYLARHYEEEGPRVLRMLAVEYEVPEVARIVRCGRDLHRAWVERVLAPLIEPSEGTARRRRLAMLVAATDVLTWKLLRIEQELSQRDYARALLDLLEALQ
jgi:AcrR family transcriptional regulator